MKKSLDEIRNELADKHIEEQDYDEDCLTQRTQPGTPVGEHIDHITCGCFIHETFQKGWDALLEHLLNNGPKGDYDENVMCSLASRKHGTGERNGSYKDGFIDGNSSKYIESAAYIAARDAEIDKLKQAYDVLKKACESNSKSFFDGPGSYIARQFEDRIKESRIALKYSEEILK